MTHRSGFKKLSLAVVTLSLLALMVGLFPATALSVQAKSQNGRYVVKAKSAAEFDALKADAISSGAKIISEIRKVNTLVVSASDSAKLQLAASSHTSSMGKDQIRHLIQPNQSEEMFNQATVAQNLQRLQASAPGQAKKTVSGDPANSFPGLMWNLDRVRAPEAWAKTTGDPSVLVGVADTGLDFTHSELASQVVSVVDFTDDLCKTYFGASDQDWADTYGGPATTDWNGHGSWIGGNIAGALDGVGINGIAPSVKLVALKISQWCGSAFDSSIIDAFIYAADHNIPVVSISFGGYLDRSDPDQDTIYQIYNEVTNYAWSKGTIIVAAAGNEHLRIGDGGKVLSHGPLATPGAPFQDYYGLYEVPGGLDHVIDVSSTGNVVGTPSASCPSGTTGANATCKPTSDAHQPFGAGKQNQLAYYSNYGPRIDIAAPGGARKFNLPTWDRGGTPGFPYTTADGTTAFEDFSITSNWALEIPCFYLDGPFYFKECYSTIQGTSMATPHVSAVLGLLASQHPGATNNPKVLVDQLKRGATPITGNTTPGLSATDTSASDRTGVACPSGYCHLGGPAISDAEAYGAGLVNALGALVPANGNR